MLAETVEVTPDSLAPLDWQLQVYECVSVCLCACVWVMGGSMVRKAMGGGLKDSVLGLGKCGIG